MKKVIFVLICCMAVTVVKAQQLDSLQTRIMRFNEYLGFVKKYHPIARQANLSLNMAQAELMKARGGFDPEIKVDYNQKEFKGTEYYDILNSTFKIPVWFGIDLKAGFEQNEGSFLNPERTVPQEGLYSAGVSVALGQGLFINDRMASLKKAKVFQHITQAARDIEVNQVLYDAAVAYFDWFKAYNELQIYKNFLENASIRYRGIQQRVQAGDLAGIDTVEAKITVQNRTLSLEQARIKLLKSKLKAANFLWLDDVPVELQPQIIPDTLLPEHIDKTLNLNYAFDENFQLENHPKIQALDLKIQSLEIDRKLKAEKLKPKLDLGYNFLTPDAADLNTLTPNDYKFTVFFKLPLFLRKERGDLRLAKLKIKDAKFTYDLESLRLKNKISANYQELYSFDTQIALMNTMVGDYQTLLMAEERKFSFGESSVFLINSRERSFITARLKQNELLTKFMRSKAELFRTLVSPFDQ